MNSSICTALFPVAGTIRGNGATATIHTQDRELQVIIEKPVIRFAIEEALRAGIRRFIFIVSADRPLFESQLQAIWDAVKASCEMDVQLEGIFLRQPDRKGLGHAILLAKDYLKNQGFAVLIPNLMVLGEEAGLKRMVGAYRQGSILIGHTERPKDKLRNFGVLELGPGTEQAVHAVHEKPSDADFFSSAAAFGRWILTPHIWEALDKCALQDGEISLTAAINSLIGRIPIHGAPVGGLCFDLRRPDGFVQATLACALQRPDLAGAVLDAHRSFMDSGVRTLRAAAWSQRYGFLSTLALLAQLIEKDFPGRIALVSSFGADSVVLLHLVARVSNEVPILFIETAKLFAETLIYQRKLAKRLGLRDVRFVRPDPEAIQRLDREGELYRTGPEACCELRKTLPLKSALQGFDVWLTGRKRYQGKIRADLDLFEEDEEARLKVNPLHAWTREEIASYISRHDLPEHPLKHNGYRSIGCAPCTSPVADGEDDRAGRWRGTGKSECGIHLV